MLTQPYIGAQDYQAKDTYEDFLIKSARWCDTNGYQMLTGTTGRYVVQQVREDICDAALENDCEFVLMVDDDMVVPADALSKLVPHLEAGYDIISPLAFQRVPPFFPVMYHLIETPPKSGVGPIRVDFKKVTEWERGEIYHPDAMGFGMVLFKTKILRKLRKPWFSSWKQIGEDIWFSWCAKKAGFKIGVDTSWHIGHLADRPMIGLEQFDEFQDKGYITCFKIPKELLEK